MVWWFLMLNLVYESFTLVVSGISIAVSRFYEFPPNSPHFRRFPDCRSHLDVARIQLDNCVSLSVQHGSERKSREDCSYCVCRVVCDLVWACPRIWLG